MFSLTDKEVNVGRQRELDLVKGFLMIMIVFIHSFQTIAGEAAADSGVHKIMFALFMPTGVCICLLWALEVYLHATPSQKTWLKMA